MPHTRTSITGASFALALIVSLSLSGPWAPLPPRVREMCGEPPIPDESLCNVDERLQDALLLVEQVLAEPDTAIPDGVRTIARRRLVTVEWYPNPDPTAIQVGLMGLYQEESHRVYLPQGLRAEPLRVRAGVIGHELGHATLLFDDIGAGRRPSEQCLDLEARAYKIGMIVYERARRQVPEPDGSEGSADRHLSDEVELWRRFSGGGELTPEGLEDLANRHIFLHGYAIDCNWR